MESAPKVRLTRRVTFSSGHRYWFENLSDSDNRALFGRWASPFSHGHNYGLEVSVEGEVESKTGMVVNIKRIDDIVRDSIVSLLDGRSLNDEVSYFRDHAPTVENILTFVRMELSEPGTLPSETPLVALKLEETSQLYGELVKGNTSWKTSVTRVYEFAASHRLHSEALSEQENWDLFGKCNNPAGHGHNFVLEVTVEGEPDDRTGMIANIQEIDDRVTELVVAKFDHKNLNVDIPEFGGRVITSEILASEIFRMLDGRLPAKLSRVRLFETARSYFEVVATT